MTEETTIAFHYDPSSPKVADKVTIFHLDDDLIARKLTTMILLKEVDVNLISASDSHTALSFLSENPDTVDILIQDYLRPHMDGLQLLDILRIDSILNTLPVIFLTDGFPYEEEYQKAKELNVPVVLKPLSATQEIIDAIEEALKDKPKKLIYKEL